MPSDLGSSPRRAPRAARASALLGGGVLAVCAAVLVTLVPGLAPATILLALLVLGGSLVALDRRRARRESGRLRHLEDVVRQNHKRTSEWDWRLNERLTALGAPRIGPPARARVPGSAARGAVDDRVVTRVLAAGLVDLDYYAAVANERFASDDEAARHWLADGSVHVLSPHPFLDLSRVPGRVEADLRAGRPEGLLNYLDSTRAADSAARGMLDPASFGEAPTGTVTDVLCRLSTDSGGRSTAGHRVRAVLIDQARTFHRHERQAHATTSAGPDPVAEAATLNRLLSTGRVTSEVVSILLVVDGRAHLVDRAIATVRGQVWDRWELIVVGVGEIAGPAVEAARQAARSDSRITVLDGPADVESAAYARALEVARGAWLAFLDTDHVWSPEFLRASLVAHSGGFSYTSSAVARASGVVVHDTSTGGHETLLVRNHIDRSAALIRRDVLDRAGGIDTALPGAWDHDVFLRASELVEPDHLQFLGSTLIEDAARPSLPQGSGVWSVLGRAWDRELSAGAPRVEGRVSVVIPTWEDADMTCRAVARVLADESWPDLEVLVVDNGSDLAVGQRLARLSGTSESVRYFRLPRNLHFAIASNVGARLSTGDHILLLNNDTELRAGAIAALRAALAPDVVAVQPLLLYPDETIQCAGVVVNAPHSLPGHFLVGHPRHDALAVRSLDMTALTGAALYLRAEHFTAIHGFDPGYVDGLEDVDLCLRLRDAGLGALRVEPAAVVTHHESRTPGRHAHQADNRRRFLERWVAELPSADLDVYARAGWGVAALDSDRTEVPAPVPTLARAPGAPRRWGIYIASDGGERGDAWGDTWFADSLAAAFRDRGSSAVVHRAQAHLTASTRFDDVALVIRGKRPVPPVPGKVNVLWVISHPEDVTAEELRRYDLVYAASPRWAARASAWSGREVEVLLQATDPRRFSPPRGGDDGRTTRLTFVGSRHPGRDRPAIAAAAAARGFQVHGAGWEGLLPDRVIASRGVDNRHLVDVYRRARIVLAEHWSQMAEQGFVQNRVFDAVASGAPVLADAVEGLDEIFGETVRTYRDVDDLPRALSALEQDYPGEDARIRAAEQVRSSHSFDVRAAALDVAVDRLTRRSIDRTMTGEPSGSEEPRR